MRHYANQFLAALVFAVLTETLVVFFMLRHVLKLRNIGGLQIAYAGLMANVSSLPYLWFVLPAFCRRYTLMVALGEVAVFLWEAGFYRMYLRIHFKQAVALSFAANLTSFLLGLLVFG